MWFRSSVAMSVIAVMAVFASFAHAEEKVDEAKKKELMKLGMTVYNQVCIACHQPTGKGLPPMFPPLAGSDWATTDVPEILPRIVLHGLQGPIKINGKPFVSPNPIMPPQGMVLDNKKIAAALTYIRNTWGNKGSVITEEFVAAIRKKEAARKKMWTEAELEKIKEEVRAARKKKAAEKK